MEKQDKTEWYCWVVKTGKFCVVESFIESDVPEILDIYYPLIQKEKSIYGKIVVRDMPLFAGYVFLKYKFSAEVHYRLKRHPFITTYIGKCAQSDIDCIENIRVREDNKEFRSKREFDVGDEILIVNGQFVNFKGIITKVSRDRYFVEVPIFNRKVMVSCTIDDIVSESGDLFEW